MHPVKALKPLEALNRLLQIATRYCVSQTFFTVCNLGLFEEMGKGRQLARIYAKD